MRGGSLQRPLLQAGPGLWRGRCPRAAASTRTTTRSSGTSARSARRRPPGQRLNMATLDTLDTLDTVDTLECRYCRYSRLVRLCECGQVEMLAAGGRRAPAPAPRGPWRGAAPSRPRTRSCRPARARTRRSPPPSPSTSGRTSSAHSFLLLSGTLTI